MEQSIRSIEITIGPSSENGIAEHITLTEPVKEKSVSVMMTRHLIPCSLAYSYCSVRLGSGVGTNSA